LYRTRLPGVMTDMYHRHWVFHGASIAVGLTTALAFFMQESRPKQLLRKKVKVVSQKAETKDLEGQVETSVPGPKEFFQTSLSLPLRLFFTEPIVCLSSVMGATVVRPTLMLLLCSLSSPADSITGQYLLPLCRSSARCLYRVLKFQHPPRLSGVPDSCSWDSNLSPTSFLRRLYRQTPR
jgi:hypothetical protein